MYHLLPFKFGRISDRELIVNEIGDYLVAPTGSVEKIVGKQINPTDPLYKDLVANWFISEKPIPDLIDNYAVRLRTKKAFLDSFTALHIFVLTLRCNQNCVYCQASSKEKGFSAHYDMSEETIRHAVDLMFESPSEHLTMEFQGGESTLVPHLLRYAIETAEVVNETKKKDITYVLCTNCVDISDEILDLCQKYGLIISTSLDGFDHLHNTNRGKKESYQKTIAGIEKCREVLGADKVSALMTTSETSLGYPREIVDVYRANGFRSIFIRALNPYGLATINDDWDYYFESFIEFYKKALDYILEINKSGEFFVEEFTALILRKILTPFSTGFVDLQSPAGIINSVVVYNYDGYVYASDESRMLAEFGDYTFRLGLVKDFYENLFYGPKAQELAKIWVTEALAGCSDCVFQTYCGADPVRNYSTQGDPYGHRPSSWFCEKHKAVIEHIFELLIERHDEVLPIFRNWIVQTQG
jgi:His-Xaa-Ser system radical SAM maturase HxsB